MTQAQADANLCGLIPEENDPRFVAQHLSAYAFTRPYAAGKRVLEVGFGEGYGTASLAEVAQEVVGIELAPGNIPRAQAKYPRPNLRFLQMDATRLEFADGSFDAACSFQVIEHIPEPQLLTYASEIFRVLRPAGVCVISTLNLAHNMKPGQPYQKLIYHEKEFTAPDLQVLLSQVFPVVELYGLHLTPRHRLYQRLKKWGLDRLGPSPLNPVARFYGRASVADFRVTRNVSPAALDLYALCRKSPR
ncbi:MAG: class I SAM-dependent methyltransferase [Candidatus Omnitrophica bacterium]|nr:class I SAM-dependent methyltransferase [Candidatus Omnitrophota bacterium]